MGRPGPLRPPPEAGRRWPSAPVTVPALPRVRTWGRTWGHAMGLDTDFPSFSRRCPPRALLPPGILACWPSGCTGHSGPGGGGDACTCWMCPLCGHTKQGPGPPPCRSLVWETLPLQGGSGRGPKQPLSPDHVAHSVTCDFPEGLWHFIRMARDGRHRPGRSRG